MAAPETVADLVEELVRHRRLPEREFRTEWEGTQAVHDAANDFRRARLGLGPADRADHGSGTREGVQLTIDTQTETYEQAIAAVQAAYGLNPAAVASSWPDAPAAVPRPGPESLSGEDLGRAGRSGCWAPGTGSRGRATGCGVLPVGAPSAAGPRPPAAPPARRGPPAPRQPAVGTARLRNPPLSPSCDFATLSNEASPARALIHRAVRRNKAL